MFRLWEWLTGWWRPAVIDPFPAGPATEYVVVPEPRKPRRQAPEVWGEFYFRDVILDQLDHYFVVLARMRKGDRQSYDLFSRIGAHIVPSKGWVVDPKSADYLPGWWREKLPARGGVFFGDSVMDKTERETKFIYPRALHFLKYSPRGVPIEVQPVNAGTVYMMAVYWDRPGETKWQKYVGNKGVVQEWPVLISEDGDIRVLRVLHTKHTVVNGKKGYERGKFAIPNRRWGIPDCYVEWAKDHDEHVEDFLRHIFVHAAETYMLANASMTRVAVTRGNLTGVFAVDVVRTPYFFKDREVTFNDKGTRKRIFHIVRAHERTAPDGSKKPVRLHFRGERKFNWNGYGISITVPGWHHLDIAELDIAAYDEDSDEGHELLAKGVDGIGPKAFANHITGWINTGLGHIRRR